MSIEKSISELIFYALKNELIKEEDKNYTINLIIDALAIKEFEFIDSKNDNLEEILNNILDYAIENKIIADNIVEKDLFDTKIMGLLVPRPSEVIAKFEDLKKEDIKKATEYYYKLSRVSDYIREYRIKKDIKWKIDTKYGDLDITINLSKPEKDPKQIALALSSSNISYPKCLLCKENEGYAGRINHPARQNLRLIPLELNNTRWYLQYSPYVYYNEHCIVFSDKHSKMTIDKATFRKLLDFVGVFKHYILGSNADLPIVGGSILSHEHFQGGSYEFPMAKAEKEIEIEFDLYKDVSASILKWPMSVIRLSSKNKESLLDLAELILDSWKEYKDEKAYIFAKIGDVLHSTITPIARFKDESYELDLVLRNNICTDERPDGLYHPRPELHNIKKENIGLIEVMGLAILPSRLKKEMQILKEYILDKKDISSCEEIKKHKDWVESFIFKYTVNEDNIEDILKKEIGKAFLEVLKDAGVYKLDKEGRENFLRFISYVNERKK